MRPELPKLFLKIEGKDRKPDRRTREKNKA